MRDYLAITSKIIVDINDIKDVCGLEYRGKLDKDLTGKYVIRIFTKTPFIDILCDSFSEARQLYCKIIKSRKIININEFKRKE